MKDSYDVLVVGGGHAGVEAALGAARSGARTLLLTQSIDSLGQMSCNPAIGGIGKSHLVREIDALGGVMAQATDLAGIQFRVLNERKGAAVRATRAQVDRQLYKQAIQRFIFKQTNLSVFQQSVVDLVVTGDRVEGVLTQMGCTFYAPAVVLATGTFLGGKIHIGLTQQSGGRAGDPASLPLADRLRALPLKVGRLKTGTPPRIDGNTINFSNLAVQEGDQPVPVMSFLGQVADHPQQTHCYITYTNPNTHEIIKNSLSESPLYTGVIEGTGPRYCPSIEDKVMRFSDRSKHQIFIEPEGLNTKEIYPNGISTSLPFSAQKAFIRSIKGFEQAHITRPGYAIEYDYFDPRDLQFSLQTKCLKGLFLAGQINGTTGYEEAAAQGLVAGVNAARLAQKLSPWVIAREEAYIGVMIDDLITQGVLEPYRMFTSRSEYRLRLREDNADARLTPKGRELGIVDDERWACYQNRQKSIQSGLQFLSETYIQPKTTAAQLLQELSGTDVTQSACLADLLKRPQVQITTLLKVLAGANLPVPDFLDDCWKHLETQIKYAGYILRQEREIRQLRKQQNLVIPTRFPFTRISGLSVEQRERLTEFQPSNLKEAAGLPGMTPVALSLLAVHIKKATHQAALTESV